MLFYPTLEMGRSHLRAQNISSLLTGFAVARSNGFIDVAILFGWVLVVEMGLLEDRERQLLERLAAEGKATRLYESDQPVAKSLEGVGLLFLIGEVEPYAVITPKGRRLLAEPAQKPPKPPKPPLGFLE